eukprot:CAMPEP_0185704480 /NCGR_PEP_ID=MMETSP1164-20130828/17239_1 /TAXON_ID=1104430 /ORGANISM="Chrysoreinhardia sp, Strain CCMP2950" /LENGTH=280 /DNA_ID=CAMNT_0028371837 /DNA_START=46 /DNA_END=885 /DNA_ORIENTATION=-
MSQPPDCAASLSTAGTAPFCTRRVSLQQRRGSRRRAPLERMKRTARVRRLAVAELETDGEVDDLLDARLEQADAAVDVRDDDVVDEGDLLADAPQDGDERDADDDGQRVRGDEIDDLDGGQLVLLLDGVHQDGPPLLGDVLVLHEGAHVGLRVFVRHERAAVRRVLSVRVDHLLGRRRICRHLEGHPDRQVRALRLGRRQRAERQSVTTAWPPPQAAAARRCGRVGGGRARPADWPTRGAPRQRVCAHSSAEVAPVVVGPHGRRDRDEGGREQTQARGKG